MKSGHEEPPGDYSTKGKRAFFNRKRINPEQPRSHLQETADKIANLLISENRFMTMIEIIDDGDIRPEDAFVTLPVMYANNWLLKKYTSGNKVLIVGYDEIKQTEQGLFARTSVFDKMLSDAGIERNKSYIEVINGNSNLVVNYGIIRNDGLGDDFGIAPMEPSISEPTA